MSTVAWVTAQVLVAGALALDGTRDIAGSRTTHPVDRYWRFQLTEAGLLLAASLSPGAVVWRRTR